jgi:hypothetical protein
VTQAGFRKNLNCTEQVLTLTSKLDSNVSSKLMHTTHLER